MDPDKANQNKEFRENLEKNQIESDNIYSFGVVNLKDAPLLPNAIVRAMIRKKVKQTGAAIYTDPDYMLRDGVESGGRERYVRVDFREQGQRDRVFVEGGAFAESNR